MKKMEIVSQRFFKSLVQLFITREKVSFLSLKIDFQK